MTRLPYSLPFLSRHFTKEILQFIRKKLNVLLEDIVYETPDGRIFTNHLSNVMNFIESYYDLWLYIGNKKCSKFLKDIKNDIHELFEDHDSNFEERTINEIEEYFDKLTYNDIMIDDSRSRG